MHTWTCKTFPKSFCVTYVHQTKKQKQYVIRKTFYFRFGIILSVVILNIKLIMIIHVTVINLYY